CKGVLHGIDKSLSVHGISDESAMLILSPEYFHTRFHCDAFVGPPELAGGGWMYLQAGWKVWTLLDFDDAFETLYAPRTRSLMDLPMAQLLYAKNCHNWRRVWNGEIFDGDFLYFPPAMCHRVKTYRKSFGVGGYMTNAGRDAARIEAASKAFLAHGTDGGYGLWKERDPD